MICTEMNIAIAMTTNQENINEIKELNKLNELFLKFDCDKYGFKPFELKKIHSLLTINLFLQELKY